MKGIDYAWSHPSISSISANGLSFVCRYLSHDSSKSLSLNEKNALNSAGISVVVVFEDSAQRMLNGHSAGVADAQFSDSYVKSLGMAGIPIYFACDFDATSTQQTAINAYLDGVASVIGRDRTGIYSGYWPLKRAFDAGKVTYGWQTFAWSGGNWDSRAQLRQVQNDISVGGVGCDLDVNTVADFGQWPNSQSQSTGGTVSVTVTMPVLQQGDSDQAGQVWQVHFLQDVLNERGQYHGWSVPLTVDGAFGPATDAVVRQAQTFYGLSVDGIVGADTWTKLVQGY